MKHLKALLTLLLGVSLSVCPIKAADLQHLYYPFNGDTQPFPLTEVNNPNDLRNQPWNIKKLSKLKSLPIYTYELLEFDEMMKQAETIEALFGLKSNRIRKNFSENGRENIYLVGDNHRLYFYENGSYSLRFDEPLSVSKQAYATNEFNDSSFIKQLARNFYKQHLTELVSYTKPQISVTYQSGFRGVITASATIQEAASQQQAKQFNASYNTLTLSFDEHGLTQIDYHAPAKVLVGNADLLSVDEAIEQLKLFIDDETMPEIKKIHDGKLFYANAFELKQTIPVYQLYYKNSEEPNTYHIMQAPAVKLDKEYLDSKQTKEQQAIANAAINSAPLSLQVSLPNDLTMIKQNKDAKFSYTAAGGVGAAGGLYYFYTEKQLEAIKSSRWNLTNFTSDALFPIYHKASLSEADMQSMADAICNYFNATIKSIEYYEPLDFHADDFILTRSHRMDSTQKSLTVDTDLFYLRINEHGTVVLSIDLPYADTTDFPYSKNPDSNYTEYIDPQANTEKNTAFYQREMLTAYERIFKNLWTLDKPIADIQEVSASSIATNHELDYWTRLEENRADLTLSQQLFAASYQQLGFRFKEEGLNSIFYTPIIGTKICDTTLLSVDDAIRQFNQLMAIPPQINEVLTVTVGYNTEDYLYDTIPVYNVYYREDDRIKCAAMPAVTIDLDQYYVAPNIMFELHMDDVFRKE